MVMFIAMSVLGLSMLSAKSQKMVDLKSQNKVLDSQLSSLGRARKEVQQYSYFKQVAKSVIPSDKDQAHAVLDIFQLADEAGISLQSVTFPSSNLGSSVPPTSAADSTSTSGSNAQTAAPQTVISQAKPVTGISGLYSIELTITPATGPQVPANKQVTYPKMLDFLDRLERNRRTSQITQVNVQTLTGNVGSNQLINFSLTTNIFIRPSKT
jgi:hypothetical protein